MERRITRSVSRDLSLGRNLNVLKEKTNIHKGSSPKDIGSNFNVNKGLSKGDNKIWKDPSISKPKHIPESSDIGSSLCDRTIYPSSLSSEFAFNGKSILDDSFGNGEFSPVVCNDLFFDDLAFDRFSDLAPGQSREDSGLTLSILEDSFTEQDCLDILDIELQAQELEISCSLPNKMLSAFNNLKHNNSLPDLKIQDGPKLRSHTKDSKNSSGEHNTPAR